MPLEGMAKAPRHPVASRSTGLESSYCTIRDKHIRGVCETLFTAQEEGRTWAEVAGGVVTMFEGTASNETAEGVSA